MKHSQLIIRTMELANEPDETLMRMATHFRSRYSGKSTAEETVSRKAARRVLQSRGYIFDPATGRHIGRKSGYAVRAVVVGSERGACESTITEPVA